MDYFYDILINMNEENVYSFYEWDISDPIELIKKIPLFRVDTKIIKDFLLYDINIDNDFLKKLEDKTILKNNKLNKTIKYACLLNDTKNSLVVEFDNLGRIISRSCLLLDDDANVLELIYNFKETKIEYKKQKIRNIKKEIRQEKLMKKIIKLEVDTLIENKNYLKLKYIFNEWFGYEESSISKIRDIIYHELNKDLNENIEEIYHLIMLSYNKS